MSKYCHSIVFVTPFLKTSLQEGLREKKVLDSEHVEQSVVAALVREESGYCSDDFERKETTSP